MFDFGFTELVLIGVVALIVIGPERLPKTARTVGHLLGRLQRYVSDVKSDIQREMELDELRKLRQEVQSTARDIETSVDNAVRGVESEVRSVESQLNAVAETDAPLPVAASEVVTGDQGEHPAAADPSPVSAEAPETPAAGDAPVRQKTLPGFEQP